MADAAVGEADMAGSAAGAARAWLTAMHTCVRAIDYDGARALFREDVVGFGTYSGVLDGLDALVAGQWSNVWPTIRDFTFRLDEARAGRDGALLWIACPWDSVGTRADGTTFDRPGRMSVVLTCGEDGRWRAAHTHFSLYPVTDPSPGPSPKREG